MFPVVPPFAEGAVELPVVGVGFVFEVGEVVCPVLFAAGAPEAPVLGLGAP